MNPSSTKKGLRPLRAALAAILFLTFPGSARATRPTWLPEASAVLEAGLGAKLDKNAQARLRRGLEQVSSFWTDKDGDRAAFEAFVNEGFAADQASLDGVFERMESLLESLSGHMNGITLAFRARSDLDLGPLTPLDRITAGWDPSAHVTDDFFDDKLAFAVLLNFPLTTLEERLADGPKWTRRQWAEARLAQRFSKRVPAEVKLAASKAESRAQDYISGYNIWMGHVLDEKGRRLFPADMRLLSHWNLRDQIKADYSEPKDGLIRQRTIAKVMERILTQSIPKGVIDDPKADWNPFTNEVSSAASREREPDTRYSVLWDNYAAARRADPYSPTSPTLIARRFDEEMELPEPRVKAMLEEVLSSPTVEKVARLIEGRLGRPLEPFDIWYNGFAPRGATTEARLDELVRRRYPDAEAFRKDIPNLLGKLGFSEEKARYAAEHIAVDPARGSGHAWGPEMRSEPARLRTRVGKEGMDYKGFNIAVHEMGHNVEQVFSLYGIDHVLLKGVPNNAFTEALAFVFQGHDLELLGLSVPDEKTLALKTLKDFWDAYEISGVALVDMGVWHWMYEHPEAKPADLREAALRISKDVWNAHYAPVFRKKDVVLLGIYSHMIDYPLYLPNYPVGHMIAFQVEERMREAGGIGAEFERMAVFGSLAPDLWMKNASGSPVGPKALLKAAERALAATP